MVEDAKGDIQRGLEVIEFACGIPQALKGEYTQGAGPGIDVYSMRQPLGAMLSVDDVAAIAVHIDNTDAGVRRSSGEDSEGCVYTTLHSVSDVRARCIR